MLTFLSLVALLAGCATAPAPLACSAALTGDQYDHAWWIRECRGRMGGGGGFISHGEVWPLRLRAMPGGGIEPY
jgi:hypothetical protein